MVILCGALLATVRPAAGSQSSSANYGIRGAFGTAGADSSFSGNYRVRGSSPNEPAFVPPTETDTTPLDEVDNLSSSNYAIIPGFIGALINLVAGAAGLSAPDLLAYGGVTLGTHTPVLNWNDVSGALTYRVEIDVSSAFSDPDSFTGITTSQLSTGTSFAEGLYYWRVKAIGSGGQESSFSVADSFRIVPALAIWVMCLTGVGMAGWAIRRKPGSGRIR
jgi:hypothetical protein